MIKSRVIRKHQNWSWGDSIPKCIKGWLLLRSPFKCGVGFSQVKQRSSDVWESFYEPPIEVDEPQEWLDFLFIRWSWPFWDSCHFSWIHFDQIVRDNHSKIFNRGLFELAFCYISFSLSSFYQLSWCSDSAPDVYLHFVLIILPHVTLSTFILFPVSSIFLLFPTFTCAPISPSTYFHFSFHVLWLCSQPFPSYYDTLYFYELSSSHSQLILTQYINCCILLVVLQFVNWWWFISSLIFSLSLLSILKSPSSLSSLSSSSGNYIY